MGVTRYVVLLRRKAAAGYAKGCPRWSRSKAALGAIGRGQMVLRRRGSSRPRKGVVKWSRIKAALVLTWAWTDGPAQQGHVLASSKPSTKAADEHKRD